MARLESTNKKVRNWSFTIQEPPEDYCNLLSCMDSIAYAIWQLSSVSSPFIDGYVQFVKLTSIDTVKQLLPDACWVRSSGMLPNRRFCKNDVSRVSGTVLYEIGFPTFFNKYVRYQRNKRIHNAEFKKIQNEIHDGANVHDLYNDHAAAMEAYAEAIQEYMKMLYIDTFNKRIMK